MCTWCNILITFWIIENEETALNLFWLQLHIQINKKCKFLFGIYCLNLVIAFLQQMHYSLYTMIHTQTELSMQVLCYRVPHNCSWSWQWPWKILYTYYFNCDKLRILSKISIVKECASFNLRHVDAYLFFIRVGF